MIASGDAVTNFVYESRTLSSYSANVLHFASRTLSSGHAQSLERISKSGGVFYLPASKSAPTPFKICVINFLAATLKPVQAVVAKQYLDLACRRETDARHHAVMNAIRRTSNVQTGGLETDACRECGHGVGQSVAEFKRRPSEFPLYRRTLLGLAGIRSDQATQGLH